MAAHVTELEVHRPVLLGLCYRMLGAHGDADDAVQETMVRAWRGLDRFDERSSLRTWLCKIASNVCLDALASRGRRVRPLEEGPVGHPDDVLDTRPRTHWLEPIPDAAILPETLDPAERAALRQTVRLAFVSALQHLAPKQRAALVLADVIGCSATEIADTLDTSVPAVNSALQRARATLAEKKLDASSSPELAPADLEAVDRYVAAFERYDLEALTALLREDAVISMPPYTLWLRGRTDIRRWMSERGAGCHGSRLLRTDASGWPAYAHYRLQPEGGHAAWALMVLEARAGQVSAMTSFLDVETLFPRFGFPLTLPT